MISHKNHAAVAVPETSVADELRDESDSDWPNNKWRAEKARGALAIFYQSCGMDGQPLEEAHPSDVQNAIADLICDLLHLAQRQYDAHPDDNLETPDTLNQRALGYFEVECDEESEAAGTENVAITDTGSAVWSTNSKHIGPLSCELCERTYPGGVACSVTVTEPDGVEWLLWLLPNGWSESDISSKAEIAVCPDHQANEHVRRLTGIDQQSVAAGLRGVTEPNSDV